MSRPIKFRDWIEYDIADESTHPEQDRELWYYFEYTGVSLGKYYGEWEFAGDRGFLTGDVTHWQYAQPDGVKPKAPVY